MSSFTERDFISTFSESVGLPPMHNEVSNLLQRELEMKTLEIIQVNYSTYSS